MGMERLLSSKTSWLELLRVLMGCAAAASLPSCEDGQRFCYPGDYRSCDCPEANTGYQQCDQSGDAYGACDCSGQVPGLASGPGGEGGLGGGGSGALLPDASPCDEDEQCESALCFPFNAKGPHCTKSCAGSEDCPPPFDGCNMMGVCKVP
jgi:hypothetical protein